MFCLQALEQLTRLPIALRMTCCKMNRSKVLRGRDVQAMNLRFLILPVMVLCLAVVGYFFFGVVVAIYTGLWLHDEKMYFAQGLSVHLFGATGAVMGLISGWGIWRIAIPRQDHHGPRRCGVNQ